MAHVNQAATVGLYWRELPSVDVVLPVSYHSFMETTKLSSKGQIVLPKAVRDQHGWAPGTEFVVESTPDGVRLRAKALFPPTELTEVFGSVAHTGPAKSIEAMDAGIRAAVARRFRRAAKR
jgi:AbrB family looped-hinge helix DNA binding protein